MHTRDQNSSSAAGGRDSPRGLRYALTILALALVIGPLLAPFVFNLTVWLGRSYAPLEAWRHVDFESILGRCMLLMAGLLLWPALLTAGRAGFAVKPLFSRRERWRELAGGSLLGIGSMAIFPLLGLLLGAYVPVGDLAPAGVLPKLLGFLLVGILVGLLEEFLFRGVLFDLMNRLLGLWTALLGSSLIFSLVHFVDPVLPSGVVHGHWYSGFQTLWVAALSFAEFNVHIFPYCLTLFLIGASLCLLFRDGGKLFLVIGVHAGWIWVLQTSKQILERTERMPLFFGQDMIMSKTYGVLLVALLFFVAVIIFKHHKISVDWKVKCRRPGSGAKK